MNILFLGDIVGDSGCSAIKKYLPQIIKSRKINFVVVNGENAAKEGVGITENNVNELLNCGIDVITTGNHVWDQKETYDYIKTKKIIKTFKFEKRYSRARFWDIYLNWRF